MSSYVEDDVIPPMQDRIISIISKTRKATSAIRSAERGWDWYSRSDENGTFVEAIQIAPDKAQRSMNELMLELLYIHNDELRSGQQVFNQGK